MKKITLFFCSLAITTSVQSQIPTDGLVAYYPFNGNANDESVNNNDGTVYGATLTTDRFGNTDCAYYFDGNSRIEVADNDNLDLANEFTISIFINQFSFFIRGYRLVDKNTAGTTNGYTFDTWNGSTGNSMRLCAAGNCKYPSAPHSLNAWHHLAVTFQDGVSTFYLDGAFVGTGIHNNTILNSNNLPLYIGYCNNGNNNICNGENFDGILDDICIYNRALNQYEINFLYTGYHQIESCPSFLITPNPAKDKIIIKTESDGQLSILNLSGQQIIRCQLTEPATVIDINRLANGVYFVKLSNASTIAVKKLVKQ
jgi:hypothetical protein